MIQTLWEERKELVLKYTKSCKREVGLNIRVGKAKSVVKKDDKKNRQNIKH